ncbi:MAG: DUF3305 domain-containing protein [Alphaproteobacteria bacterium HGW-Alphaproteobacteria-2]|nr:MAG: DUF3305 domain-containing protein [Alphaproteobacteria bacterium HGW-Alphaproteobacteria-2]
MSQAQPPSDAPAPAPREVALPLGVVVRRQPGVTRWAKWVWRPIAVLPGAAPADWKLLREDETGAADYHAATLSLTLHRAVVEGYKVALSMTPPAVFVVLRRDERPDARMPWSVHDVTASAYEAQDYLDSAEDIVEAVVMPPVLEAWVRGFTDAHFREEPFVKRSRDGKGGNRPAAGRADPRIREADVFRVPGAAKAGPEGQA